MGFTKQLRKKYLQNNILLWRTIMSMYDMIGIKHFKHNSKYSSLSSVAS